MLLFLESLLLLLLILKVILIDVLVAWFFLLIYGLGIIIVELIDCIVFGVLCIFIGFLLVVDWILFSIILLVFVNWRVGEWFLFDDFNRFGGELIVNSFGSGSFFVVLFVLGVIGCWIVEGFGIVVVVGFFCVLGNMFFFVRVLLNRLVRVVWRI